MISLERLNELHAVLGQESGVFGRDLTPEEIAFIEQDQEANPQNALGGPPPTIAISMAQKSTLATALFTERQTLLLKILAMVALPSETILASSSNGIGELLVMLVDACRSEVCETKKWATAIKLRAESVRNTW